MPSATEPSDPGKSLRASRFRAGFERWNRKLHFYTGLFLLFFMWLFAFSGLLLNQSVLELCGILEQPQRNEL